MLKVNFATVNGVSALLRQMWRHF